MKGIDKRSGIALGVLFILPFFFYGIGTELLDPLYDSNSEPISSFQIKLASLMVIGNSIIVIGISILLYPLLWYYNKRLALWYLCSRLVESILLAIGLTATLSFVYIDENSLSLTQLENFKWFAHGISYYTFQISMLILAIGSIPVFYLFYKEELVPIILTAWAIVGYILLFIGAIAELLGYHYGVMLSVFGGLFEMSFGVWLIVKGVSRKNEESKFLVSDAKFI